MEMNDLIYTEKKRELSVGEGNTSSPTGYKAESREYAWIEIFSDTLQERVIVCLDAGRYLRLRRENENIAVYTGKELNMLYNENKKLTSEDFKVIHTIKKKFQGMIQNIQEKKNND